MQCFMVCSKYLSITVAGMFHNTFLIAQYNKCDITAGVLFEEEIIQKIVTHLIHSCKKHSSTNTVDFYWMCTLLYK
jgi:hypothetical protein